MGATTHERQAINKHVNRGGPGVLDHANTDAAMKTRYTLTLIRFSGEEVRKLCTLEYFTESHARNMHRALSADWDVAYLTDKEESKMLTEQAI